MLGKRQARLWDDVVWVTIRATKESGLYRILPDEGDEFNVAADLEEELQECIERELRRQFPQR